jgi:alpha-L-fucosidase
MRIKAHTILLLLTAATLFPSFARCQQPQTNPNTGETPEQFAARTKWWREAKFGMFIHWGIYAVPADATNKDGSKSAAEWYFYNKQAQVKDYEKFAGQFNPAKFSAKQWVKTAKDAGMKYIVITSKHHDGFCMFDSKLTNYCITKATPFKRDPMKELAAECKKQGVKLCFYHSIMDWHHQEYVPRRPWEKDTRPAGNADLNKYIDYMKGQLTELLSNYGPVGGIWFDGGWEHNAAELHSADVNLLIRKLQPGVIINDRNQEQQDYSTPEQTIPANAMAGGRLWETCMTMNDTWGYARNDNDWKTAEDLIHKLCDIASKGGNFLMNVGPTDLGTFPDAINERLAVMGKWMKVNGVSIYATEKSPFKKLPFDGRCTQKGNSLYLQVFKWPEKGLFLRGLQTNVESARALDGNESLNAVLAAGSETSDDKVWHIGQPNKTDKYATVIELKLAGPPVVTELTPPIRPEADGSLLLKAVDAEIHGNTAQYEQGGGKDNIGFWIKSEDYVSWKVDSPGGRYKVEVTYACPDENAGSEFTVSPFEKRSDPQPHGVVKSTGSWTTFKTETIGVMDLVSGQHTIQVNVTKMPRGAVMNLKSVRLIPIK